MFGYILKKIIGSTNDRYIKRKMQTVAAIGALESEMQTLQDADFAVRIAAYKEAVAKNEKNLDELLPEVFALVREASKRVLGMRHFDVQLVGGMVLHSGKIAEMRTGEGKTLMATLPVVLNALSGKGVHVVTVNDYLAKRDAEWMGKLYNFLGLTTGVVIHGISEEDRQAAYAADITYGTNNEFGFDYLRDNMKFYQNQLVQRPHNFAIVDEVDSILIDEARTPLIISGAADDSTDMYSRINAIIGHLKREEHFTLDEKTKSVMLTDEGIQRCEDLLGIDNLFDTQNITVQHHVQQALKAHYAFRRDVDYVVKEGQVVIVDEFTGRLMPGRRFSDGLHQAIEAKEQVKVEAENQTLASITFQNYFRLYKKLGGMTGTADTEAVEFQEIYGLQAITIPTHMPMVRKDLPDVVYRSRAEKFMAIADHIKELHEKGQPVLVGTISIETSELLSGILQKHKVPHNVLNAKHHEQEAAIIAEAGQRGKVTIATNMAGRGTDIALGEGVRELGGLFILGTERHESRRIDNQLRGRSGRQGDPGCSRFFLSLEDDLMRLFGSERIAGLMETLGLKDGECIEHGMISKAIENAQKRVEGHNFEIRKTLLDYDNVMNQQREVVYSLRKEAISKQDVSEPIYEFLDSILNEMYTGYEASRGNLTAEQEDALRAHLQEIFNLDRFWQEERIPSREEMRVCIIESLEGIKKAVPDVFGDILRYFLLEEIDRCWKEHLLNMDHLRDGIGLRGYGQRDPKQEYKREGFALFQDMVFRIQENIFKTLTRLKFQISEGEGEDGERKTYLGVTVDNNENGDTAFAADSENEEQIDAAENVTPTDESATTGATVKPAVPVHKDRSHNVAYSAGGEQPEQKQMPTGNAGPKIGRNDDCPCGSGKKYKKCCGSKA